MPELSLKRAILYGDFGPFRLGMTKSEILKTAGKSESGEADIWKYGDIELLFGADRLACVNLHAFLEIPRGGAGVTLDPWVIRAGLSLDECISELIRAGKQFRAEQPNYDPSQLHLYVHENPSIHVQFLLGDDEDWPHGLHGIWLDDGPQPYALLKQAHQLAAAAWLGAVIDRLRAGKELLPKQIAADIKSFAQPAAYSPVETFDYMPSTCPGAIDVLMTELYERLQGTPNEFEVWEEVLSSFCFCPPEKVIELLLDRNPPSLLISLLGHCLLSDPLLWRLADQVPEALLTLAKRRFLNSIYVPSSFEEVLHAFPTHHWMLHSLAILASFEKDDSKRTTLARYVAKHSEIDQLLKGADRHFVELVKSLNA